MGFVKVAKSRQYYKRFQVKYRRRRCGKTDYRARRKMIIQDKNKYNAPRYRFVARITNKDVVCQVVYSKIIGDVTLCAAYAHELPRYGIKAGLTNYAACYATGLLCARRLLKSKGLDAAYGGVEEADGEDFFIEAQDDGPAPFRAVLDVGLAATTTGARVFGCLKGAVDGGLEVPHSNKRFPGYDREGKEYDAETHAKYILGGHVAEYMQMMMEEDEDKYKVHFAKYIEEEVDPDDMEELYKEAHTKIRADPAAQPTKKDAKYRRYNQKKSTLEERKVRIQAKLDARAAAQADGSDDDEDDE